MTDADVSQVRVGEFTTGIIGLKSVLQEMAGEWAEKPDAQVAAELVERLSVKNYFSESAKVLYGLAFLREFKKFLGKPYEDAGPGQLEIKILGPGCATCDRTGSPRRYRPRTRYQGNRQIRGHGLPCPGHKRQGQSRGQSPHEK